jgi:ABC-2 type transport system permease protein
MALYGKLVWVSFKGQMQYRLSFTMMLLGNFLFSFTEYLGVWAFFSRFGRLGTWTLWEVGVFYGLGNLAFALTEAIGRGFDTFHNVVRTGDFDRVLLRPRGTVIQILGSDCQLIRVGRLAQAVMILAISLPHVGTHWGIWHWLLAGEAVLGGAVMFMGVIMAQAASSFWLVESIEVWNVLTYGGLSSIEYPMDIYQGFLKGLFTRVLPLAAINYWPCAFLLDKGYCPAWWSFAAPLLGLPVLLAGFLIWRVGVSKYRSTGS